MCVFGILYSAASPPHHETFCIPISSKLYLHKSLPTYTYERRCGVRGRKRKAERFGPSKNKMGFDTETKETMTERKGGQEEKVTEGEKSW